MSAIFNNINSTVVNQVNGTLNVNISREDNIALIQRQLDSISEQLRRTEKDSNLKIKNALLAVGEIRQELATQSPKPEILERSLKLISGISSVASIANNIRALLPSVLNM